MLDAAVVGDVLLTHWAPGSDGEQTPAMLRHACWSRTAGCAIVLANLEAPITASSDAVERKPFNYRQRDTVTQLFDDRFVLGLANNHIMDYGVRGLADTLQALDRAGIGHAGAGLTLDCARVPCYRTIAGIETATICAADPRFQPATRSTAGTFPARPGLLAESVTEARRRARFVAVTIHMGMEHSPIPSSRQVALAEECLTAGARLVAFHHAHRVSGCSLAGGSLVLWGTGNYIALPRQHRPRPSARTAVWRMQYSASADVVTTVSIDPVLIDAAGVPRPVAQEIAARERRRIQGYSRRLQTPFRRRLWRGLVMLEPAFLKANLGNYARLLRLRGPRYVWRSVVTGIRAQLGGR